MNNETYSLVALVLAGHAWFRDLPTPWIRLHLALSNHMEEIMNLISVVNFAGETELVRADQIESIGLPVKDKSKETYIHGWVRLISGRAIGFAEGEAEKFVAAVQGLSNPLPRGLVPFIKAEIPDRCGILNPAQRHNETDLCVLSKEHKGQCIFNYDTQRIRS